MILVRSALESRVVYCITVQIENGRSSSERRVVRLAEATRRGSLLNGNKDKRFVIGCLRLRTSGSRVSAFSDLHGAAHAGLAFYFLSLSRRAEPPPWQ